MIAFFIAHGRSDSPDHHPLHILAVRGYADGVALLIEQGADIHAPGTQGDWKGKTPLMLAVEHGHDNVIEDLRKHILL